MKTNQLIFQQKNITFVMNIILFEYTTVLFDNFTKLNKLQMP